MILDFIRQMFGSPGGKSRLASRIVSQMTEHQTYVEPFVGGGAVYFKKNPSHVEIINDKDPEIAFAYKFVKNMTDAQLKSLEKKDWYITKDKFKRLIKHKSSNDVDKFYRFICLKLASYAKKGYEAGFGVDVNICVVKRLAEIRERLKNTTIYNSDYRSLITKYDSSNTLFYLDPPYPDTTQSAEWKNKGLSWTEKDLTELRNTLKGIKGKYILSINTKYSDMFAGCKQKKVSTKRTMDKDNSWSHSYELLISNYDLQNFDIEYEDDYIKDVNNYDPKKLSNQVLADDWRIASAWYSTKRRGGNIKHSLETIVNTAKLIYDEISRRVKDGKMKHEFDPDNMKPLARELYHKVSTGKIFDMNIMNVNLAPIEFGVNTITSENLYDITGNNYVVKQDDNIIGTIRINSVDECNGGYSYNYFWIDKMEKPIKTSFNTDKFITKSNIDFAVSEHVSRILTIGSKDTPSVLLEVPNGSIQFGAGNKMNTKPTVLFINNSDENTIKHLNDFSDVSIYAPEEVWSNIVGIEDFSDTIPMEMNQSITISGFKMTPFRLNDHKCGFCIEDAVRKFSYIPDIQELTVEAKSAMENNDMWIIGGIGLPKIIEWANDMNPKNIFLINTIIDPDDLKTAKEINPNISPLEDGMIIEGIEFSKYPESQEFSDMTIINNFISLAGSYIDSGGKNFNDIDLIIRMNPPNDFVKRALYSRFSKMLNKELFDKLHFVFDAEGPHSTFIPLYDLCLKKSNASQIDMSARISIMKPYLPSKPKTPAFHDIDELVNEVI